VRLTVILVLACSCSVVCPGEDVKALRSEKAALEAGVAADRDRAEMGRSTVAAIQSRINELNANAQVLTALSEGRRVRYILHVSIRQVSYSISLKKQMADAMNEEEFDIMTDKQTYDSANPGMDLFDSFRKGSAIFKGSLGSWRLKVLSKRTIVEP
jgi:hypothetical protein